ncbi:LAQU0S36e00122g1_1 [Lachancea quebecensis]|uniref:LAQU0S36e00122g1_1 n=1 Tax=Lachancea quebecensis TaxID=1654605 RepID=A0A0N7MMI4_9SACH|nr:LAQU0S36e00122g1_1 [Lachancea quebecensis]
MEVISSRYSVVDGFLIVSQHNGRKAVIDRETCCLSLNRAEKEQINAKKLRDLSRYRTNSNDLVPCESLPLFQIVGTVPQAFTQSGCSERKSYTPNAMARARSQLLIPAFFFSDVKKHFYFSNNEEGLQPRTRDFLTSAFVEERDDMFNTVNLEKTKFNTHDLDVLRCYAIDQDLYMQECYSLLSCFQTKIRTTSQGLFMLKTTLRALDKDIENFDLDHCVMKKIAHAVAPLYFVLVNIGIFSFTHAPCLKKLIRAPIDSRIGRSYNLEIKSRYLGKLFQADLPKNAKDGATCILLEILTFRTEEYSDPDQILKARDPRDFCNKLAALIIWIGYAIFAQEADSIASSASIKCISSLDFLLDVYRNSKTQCDT